MINNHSLNSRVINNFTHVKYGYLVPPFLVLAVCGFAFLLLNEGESYVNGYIDIQKDAFVYLNSKLAVFPGLQYNLTQLGDVIILFPLVGVFVLYAPRLWEAILTSSILSIIASASLKRLFNVPRPAAILDNDSFMIIGRTLTGRTSLPSGHSITTFIVITLILFAFMPKKGWHRILWCVFMLTLGFVITFSRVGVGAHYPLDVVIGSAIGYMLSIVGIKLTTRLNWAARLKIKKPLVVLMIILVIWIGILIQEIITTNLVMAYPALIALLITAYLTAKTYVQEKN